ncbi:MAG: hypothetical protein ABJB05_09845 [Parafilimonas sp.]
MDKSELNNKTQQEKESLKNSDDLFKNKIAEDDEIESDGSASAFDETETVNEDNFDDLSEK